VTGFPGGEPRWPLYTSRQHAYLDIGEQPAARVDLEPAAFAFADALVAARLRQRRGWRLDIGFSSFPAPASAARPPAQP
jgi:para-nitrobenzyl esterase